MSGNTASSETGGTKKNPLLRALLGLLLLFPACCLCASDPLLLTFNTFLGSLRSVALAGLGEFVGMDNYAMFFTDQRQLSALGYTILIALLHVALAAILPPLLALGVNTFGRKLRLGIRLLFTLPLAFFGPALAILSPAFMRGMWDLKSPQGTYMLIDSAAALAVACAAGLLIYAMVLRGQKDSGQGGKLLSAPLIITWLVAQLGTAAFTVQSFTVFSNLLPPTRDSATLAASLYATVRFAQGGLTFAISFVMFLLVALPGIVAGLLLILGRVQLKQEPATEEMDASARNKFTIPGWVAVALGGIAALFVTLFPLVMGVIKMLTSPGGSSNLEFALLFRVWGNSILPPLLAILLVQLPVAYLGALGIGVARPFGRWSEWILLLFSPWLFVTSVPLGFAAFMNLFEMKLLDSSLALIPPILISVPMLFVLTLFFKGREPEWRKAREEGMPMMSAVLKHLIVPSLPLAALMSVFSLLAAAQDLFMPFIVAVRPDRITATTAILRFLGSGSFEPVASLVTLFGFPFFLACVAILVLLQIFYTDRLVITRETTG